MRTAAYNGAKTENGPGRGSGPGQDQDFVARWHPGADLMADKPQARQDPYERNSTARAVGSGPRGPSLIIVYRAARSNAPKSIIRPSPLDAVKRKV